MSNSINTGAANGTYKFRVEGADALERLDRFLSSRLEGKVSREKIKKCILEGRVSIDDIPCASPKRGVLAGQSISLALPEAATAAKIESGELDIVFEDKHIAVLVKPYGLSVHPSPGEPDGTLVNRLLARFPSLARMEGERPGIVHRLDKDTTGLMLVALDEAARLEMIDAFARRDVGKEYLALVYGVPARPNGRIEAPIGRDPRNKTRMAAHDKARHSLEHGARGARSDYRTLYADPSGRFSLLAVEIHSGRTHQIRVHLTHIGHPIIGDKTYTDEAAVKKALSPRELSPELKDFLPGLSGHQLLHAWRLHFAHPSGSDSIPLRFCAVPPPEFKSAALALSARLARVVLTGNPACGKSSVLKLLEKRGIPVWSADAAVAAQYRAGADGWSLIRSQYGSRFMLPGSEDTADIDKQALFAAMHDDERIRRGVEEIIHPVVLAEMLVFWDNLDALPLARPVAMAEVPLYFESLPGKKAADSGLLPGFAPARPLVIGIHCPFEIRALRMRETRSWPDGMIEKIESWQWPEDKKMAACDIVIDNSASRAALEKSLERALAEVASLRLRRLERIDKILDEMVSCASYQK